MTIGNKSNIAATGSDITANVTVGSYTSIGPYVQMHTLYNHACIEYPKIVSSYQLHDSPHPKGHEKIVIGSDVWIGRNATLLGDITIGHGAIIGAFAVVAKDVPPYAVVVGNPIVIKRYRFTEEQIAKLLKIQWWNWPDDKVEKYSEEAQKYITDLNDIDLFLEKHYNK